MQGLNAFCKTPGSSCQLAPAVDALFAGLASLEPASATPGPPAGLVPACAGCIRGAAFSLSRPSSACRAPFGDPSEIAVTRSRGTTAAIKGALDCLAGPFSNLRLRSASAPPISAGTMQKATRPPPMQMPPVAETMTRPPGQRFLDAKTNTPYTATRKEKAMPTNPTRMPGHAPWASSAVANPPKNDVKNPATIPRIPEIRAMTPPVTRMSPP